MIYLLYTLILLQGEVEDGETESEEAVDTWMDKERIDLTIDTLRYKR
jgi:hypothetical protein